MDRWQSQSKSWNWAEFIFVYKNFSLFWCQMSNFNFLGCMKLQPYCVIVWKHPLLGFLILCWTLQNALFLIAGFKPRKILHNYRHCLCIYETWPDFFLNIHDWTCFIFCSFLTPPPMCCVHYQVVDTASISCM